LAPKPAQHAGTTEAAEENPNAYLVPGLVRGIDLLEVLAREQRPMSPAQLAETLELPRSSVFRLVQTLQSKGLIEADASRRTFTLGPGVLRLGYQYLTGQDLVQIARRELELLSARVGISSHLAIRSERDIICLLHVPGTKGFVSNVNAGARFAAHATPMGQILLGQITRKQLFDLYAGVRLVALTDQTPVTLEALAARVARAAADGYVVSRGSVEAGGISISAPVHDNGGGLVAAIDISCPASAFDEQALQTHYVASLLDTARQISARIVRQ
jgi:DNA-binding IclR family transcriptional regulator